MEDICLWPDYEWCYKSDLAGMSYKYDDYEVLTWRDGYYVRANGTTVAPSELE